MIPADGIKSYKQCADHKVSLTSHLQGFKCKRHKVLKFSIPAKKFNFKQQRPEENY